MGRRAQADDKPGPLTKSIGPLDASRRSALIALGLGLLAVLAATVAGTIPGLLEALVVGRR